MEVRCSQCSTRYLVPDEKVRGRKVRLPCRRCGNAIVINARHLAGPKPTAPPAASVPPAPASGSGQRQSVRPVANVPRPEPAWNVAIDGTPKRLTVPQIADEYRSGAIARTAYVWRSGMADWALLADVPDLKRALEQVGLDLSEPEPSSAGFTDIPAFDEEVTRLYSADEEPSSATAAAQPTPPSEGRPARGPIAGALARAEAVLPRPPPSAAKDQDRVTATTIIVEEAAPPSIEPPIPTAAPPSPPSPPVVASREELTDHRRVAPSPLPKRPARLPVGTLVVMVLVIIGAGVAGFWLSQRLGRASSTPNSGQDHPRAVAMPGPTLDVLDVQTPASRVGPDAQPASPPAASAAGLDPDRPFDHDAAKLAFDAAALAVRERCRGIGPKGSGVVWLSFLPSGRAAGVSLKGSLSGTSTGRCVLQTYYDLTVAAFSGEPVVMQADVSAM
jgi:predicted Zn finger-like uncharacterized protein